MLTRLIFSAMSPGFSLGLSLGPVLGPLLGLAFVGAAAAQDLDDQERLLELRKKKLSKPFVTHAAWHLDYDQARAKAKAEGKFLLTYFTRSFAP